MANENLKIKIQEVNNTTARGAGASSDVAYVPGLARSEAKYKNTPVLCTTISEFEEAFGTEPYVMQAKDVTSTGIEYLNYEVGDVDKSYLYAKELINAGMSVVYENIVNESTTQSVATAGFVAIKGNAGAVTGSNNKFTYTAGDDTAVTATFKFALPADVTQASVHVIVDENAPAEFTAVTQSITVDTAYSKVVSVAKGTSGSHYNVTVSAEAAERPYIMYTLAVQLKDLSETKGSCGFNVVVVEGHDIKVDSDVQSAGRIVYLYDNLNAAIQKMVDKNEYSVKYLTSGGYPTFINYNGNKYALANSMLSVAGERGDAVALIDPPDNADDPLTTTDENSTYRLANEYLAGAANAEYGAMFIPWGEYACATTGTTELMPPSFGYLMCMATAIKTSPNWLAMAGVSRGLVPNLRSLHTNKLLSNMIAENYQPRYGSDTNKISVNAITNVKPYGLAIWGNRTLENVGEKGTTAHNFLNTRNMISDIKKLAYSTAKLLMFEQDSDTLWLNFKTQMSPLLDQLKSGNGISDYKLIRGTTKYNGAQLDRGELAAVIKIYPRYAIEYFEITVAIEDEEVSVN